MWRKMLRCKIHRATVTMCDPDYVGSITIDADLLQLADLRPNESVHVLDINNGNRFETYVIRGQPGSGVVAINGAAAKLVQPGDKVIIVCYAYLSPQDLDNHEAAIVLVDEHNRPVQRLWYSSLNQEQEPAAI